MVIWQPSATEKVTFRVSGTEPKLKCYLQVAGSSAELQALEALVQQKLS
jgi:phosphomannomutase